MSSSAGIERASTTRAWRERRDAHDHLIARVRLGKAPYQGVMVVVPAPTIFTSADTEEQENKPRKNCPNGYPLDAARHRNVLLWLGQNGTEVAKLCLHRGRFVCLRAICRVSAIHGRSAMMSICQPRPVPAKEPSTKGGPNGPGWRRGRNVRASGANGAAISWIGRMYPVSHLALPVHTRCSCYLPGANVVSMATPRASAAACPA
jgi:hypothetical protein